MYSFMLVKLWKVHVTVAWTFLNCHHTRGQNESESVFITVYGKWWKSGYFPPKDDFMKNNNYLEHWVGEYHGNQTFTQNLKNIKSTFDKNTLTCFYLKKSIFHFKSVFYAFMKHMNMLLPIPLMRQGKLSRRLEDIVPYTSRLRLTF